jgi:hypothetical protein
MPARMLRRQRRRFSTTRRKACARRCRRGGDIACLLLLEEHVEVQNDQTEATAGWRMNPLDAHRVSFIRRLF